MDRICIFSIIIYEIVLHLRTVRYHIKMTAHTMGHTGILHMVHAIYLQKYYSTLPVVESYGE